jgi:hypothetical protein
MHYLDSPSIMRHNRIILVPTRAMNQMTPPYNGM